MKDTLFGRWSTTQFSADRWAMTIWPGPEEVYTLYVALLTLASGTIF